MPELPDVAGFQARFNKHALDRPMSGVHVAKPRLLADTNAQGMGRRLNGRTFTETRRHGKYLLARLENEDWLVLHFGMTGDLAFYDNDDAPPEQEAVRIDFRDGGHLACISQRLLGKVEWVGSVDALTQREDLGPDALDEDLSVDSFMERFSGRRGMLKTALMDQSLIAGIGNVFADEILFQSGLKPKTGVADLEPKRLREVYNVMRRVLSTAANAHIDERTLPKSYLVRHREADAKCPRCRTALRTTKVTGRTSYYCPDCQD